MKCEATCCSYIWRLGKFVTIHPIAWFQETKEGVKHDKHVEEDEVRRALKTETVGYKVPPDASKFKSGKSGNAGGRPKKTKDDFDARIIAICDRRLPNSSATVLDLIINGAIKGATKGDMKAVKTVIDLYRDALRKRGQSIVSDEADIEAAKRILDLDPRLFADLTGEALGPKNDNASGRDDDVSDE